MKIKLTIIIWRNSFFKEQNAMTYNTVKYNIFRFILVQVDQQSYLSLTGKKGEGILIFRSSLTLKIL